MEHQTMLKTYMEKGQQFYQNKNWEEAVLIYQKVIEIQPNFPLVNYQIGESYRNLQQWENAIAAFQKEITLNPDFHWSYFSLGNTLIQLRLWKQAIDTYLKAIELQPDLAWSYYSLAYAYFQENQWEQAIANYLKVIELQPDLIDSYQNLGYCYIKLGRWHQALENYDKLLTFEEGILYPPHNYLREMLIEWKAINVLDLSKRSDSKIIKIFQADPGLYSMLNFEASGYQQKVLLMLKTKGIEVTTDQTEADLIISQYFVILESFARKYGHLKKYLLYTEEPRFDLNFEKTVDRDGVKINIMNIYTEDVFLNNYTLCIWRGNVFSQSLSRVTEDHFWRSQNKKIVALMSKHPIGGFVTLVRDGKSIDLYEIRNQIALEGHRLGKVDIYGKGWEAGITIEDSRDGDWTNRKYEILADYHFNLCFENTIAPHYCTEKIWDSIIGGCLPIYYGGKDSTIYEDFPPNSFLDYCEFNSPTELFQYIENMTFAEYQERLNLCIETFNQVGEDLRLNDFYIPKRVDNLVEKMRRIVCSYSVA